MAYVLRFINNVRTKQKAWRSTSTLTAEEIRSARNVLLIHLQTTAFPDEFDALLMAVNLKGIPDS